jgi:ParB-like chromosome segregation protein Spo0J
MKIAAIEKCEPFQSLFPKREEVERNLAETMQKEGFADPAFPVILWGPKLIDGYHRVRAAELIGLVDIPTIRKGFHSEDDAVLYCIRANAHRRHLTDAELARIIPEVDKRHRALAVDRKAEAGKKAAPYKPAEKTVQQLDTLSPPPPQRSTKETARDLGITENKVEEFRAVQEHGTAEDIKDIEEGKASIHKKAEEVKARRKKPEKPMAVRLEQERGPISQSFAKAFDVFFGELKAAKVGGWKTTSKENASAKVKTLLSLIEIGG